MIQEIWKPVKGYEADYTVSNLGNIKKQIGSIKKVMSGFLSDYGYMRVGLTSKQECVNLYIHRLVLETFIGSCPVGREARHLNGNKLDNRLSNLAWGTPKENALDRAKHGHTIQGKKCWNSKLTDDDIRNIRKEYKAGKTQKQIAIEYGVTQPTIGCVILRKTWKHVI